MYLWWIEYRTVWPPGQSHTMSAAHSPWVRLADSLNTNEGFVRNRFTRLIWEAEQDKTESKPLLAGGHRQYRLCRAPAEVVEESA